MNTELEKKNILVTGATGGIGKAIVKSFNSYKNNILLTGTNSSKLTAFSKELGENSDFVECDFSKYENIEKILDKIKSYFDNKVDVLVNNAGITRDNIALRMRREEWLDVINLNLNSDIILNENNFELNQNEEKILKKIFEWPKIIESVSKKFEIHKIPFYLYDLSTLFHSYWSRGNEDKKYKFIENEKIKRIEILAIVRLVTIVIENGMNILGVSLPKKM